MSILAERCARSVTAVNYFFRKVSGLGVFPVGRNGGHGQKDVLHSAAELALRERCALRTTVRLVNIIHVGCHEPFHVVATATWSQPALAVVHTRLPHCRRVRIRQRTGRRSYSSATGCRSARRG